MAHEYEERLRWMELRMSALERQQIAAGNIPPSQTFYTNQGPAGFIYTAELPQLTAGEVRNNVNIFQGIGGSQVPLGPQRIWNPFGVGTTQGRVGCLGGDGFGNFVIISQSCI